MSDLRPYGPGKFDTRLDAYIYDLSMNGCDDETGETETTGWYGLLRGLAVDGGMADVSPAADLTRGERAYLRKHKAGAILSADAQGFVSVAYFASTRAMEKAWRACLAATEQASEAPS